MCNNGANIMIFERAKYLGLHRTKQFSTLAEDVSNDCRRNGRSLGNRYMGGYGPIWLDDLQCTGSETQLGNCPHRGWGYHNCRHYEDVSIVCIDDSSQRGPYIVNLQVMCQHNTRIYALYVILILGFFIFISFVFSSFWFLCKCLCSTVGRLCQFLCTR